MNHIGMDPLQPAAPVRERLGGPVRGEDGPRERRQPPSSPAQTTEPAADLAVATHEANTWPETDEA